MACDDAEVVWRAGLLRAMQPCGQTQGWDKMRSNTDSWRVLSGGGRRVVVVVMITARFQTFWWGAHVIVEDFGSCAFLQTLPFHVQLICLASRLLDTDSTRRRTVIVNSSRLKPSRLSSLHTHQHVITGRVDGVSVSKQERGRHVLIPAYTCPTNGVPT